MDTIIEPSQKRRLIETVRIWYCLTNDMDDLSDEAIELIETLVAYYTAQVIDEGGARTFRELLEQADKRAEPKVNETLRREWGKFYALAAEGR